MSLMPNPRELQMGLLQKTPTSWQLPSSSTTQKEVWTLATDQKKAPRLRKRRRPMGTVGFSGRPKCWFPQSCSSNFCVGGVSLYRCFTFLRKLTNYCSIWVASLHWKVGQNWYVLRRLRHLWSELAWISNVLFGIWRTNSTGLPKKMRCYEFLDKTNRCHFGSFSSVYGFWCGPEQNVTPILVSHSHTNKVGIF